MWCLLFSLHMIGVDNFHIKTQPRLDSIARKKKQVKGKVLFDTLEMQHNEMVKCYGGRI